MQPSPVWRLGFWPTKRALVSVINKMGVRKTEVARLATPVLLAKHHAHAQLRYPPGRVRSPPPPAPVSRSALQQQTMALRGAAAAALGWAALAGCAPSASGAKPTTIMTVLVRTPSLSFHRGL